MAYARFIVRSFCGSLPCLARLHHLWQTALVVAYGIARNEGVSVGRVMQPIVGS